MITKCDDFRLSTGVTQEEGKPEMGIDTTQNTTGSNGTIKAEQPTTRRVNTKP